MKRLKYCLMCGQAMPYAHGNALRCGSEKKKTGCAFKAFKLRNKAWVKKVKYYSRPDRKEKHKEYSKKYETSTKRKAGRLKRRERINLLERMRRHKKKSLKQ